MENLTPPPAGDPSGDPAGPGSTQRFWPAQGAPADRPGPGPGRPSRPSRPGRRRRWAAAVAAAALLAAGGVAAGVALAAPAQPSAQPSAQASALNAVLSAANTGTGLPTVVARGPLAQACARARAARAGQRHSQPGTLPATALAAHPRLARLRALACRHRLLVAALLRGLHGQFTFHTKKGVRTLAFERGRIMSVAAGRDIVVRSTDGTTWTWQLLPATVVRERGVRLATSALTKGETVWVGGPVAAGARDARLVLARPASAAPASAAPASPAPAG